MPDPTQFITVENFSKGIVSNQRFATAGISLDLPPGFAAEGTVGCFANEYGQLCPLPDHNSALDQTITIGATLDQTAVVRTCGLFTAGPLAVVTGSTPAQNTSYADEVHCVFQGKKNASNLQRLEWQIQKLYRTTPTVATFNADGVNGTFSATKYRGVTGTYTRLLNAAFSGIGNPTFCLEWMESPEFSGGTGGNTWFYPDPANLTSDTPVATNQRSSQILSHVSRIVALNLKYFSHGAGNGQTYSNEHVFYTDPPNSNTFNTVTTSTILDPQNPGPFGSWGSITYGELILIKQFGGAIMVSGDLYAPNISRMWGVQGTGNLINAGSFSPKGLVYCVDNDGAYIWDGGSTSRKINSIADRFYDRVNGNPSTGAKVKHTPWGQFVVFPNGWIWDSLNEAWWQLNNDDSGHLSVPEAGRGSPNLLYFLEDQFTLPATTTLRVYDWTYLARSYTFISQSIRNPYGDRSYFDIVEATIALASVSASTTYTLKIYNEDNSLLTVLTNTITNTAGRAIMRFREPLGIKHVNNLKFSWTVQSNDSSKAAPTTTLIQFGCRPSHPLSQ